ncbi:hypothetical protein BC938DRAFT_476016 [Jimgerdemannia flammicorona]|uniref:NAD(P)-binding protein n=1 Tax=Jimgerdemannia flammicorona TaxID=994334 RepID=A0A433PLF5_9FUNG|nr:hypothetical protein BC938DRAFT_476016 [Jimgerdemannia flammicorona]
MSANLVPIILPILSIVAYLAYKHSFTSYPRLNIITPFQERVVIIGCTTGIGRELALLYAQRRARLILFARRETLLNDLKQECLQYYASEPEGGKNLIYVVAGDAINDSDVQRCTQTASSAFGGIDTLILCAGVISVLPFVDLCCLSVTKNPTGTGFSVTSVQTPDDPMTAVRRITEVNYHAPVLVTRYFLPFLISASRAPNVIVVSSMAGKTGTPTRGIYAGSKHAVHGFFDSLRVEVEKYNVHVGIVCPGTVDTGLRASAVDLRPQEAEAAVHGSTKGKLSPRACAERILRASDAREREVYVPGWYYWTLWMKVASPELLDGFARKKYGY